MSSEALRQRLAREAQEEAARVAEEKKKRREEVGVHKLNDLFTLLFVLSLQNSQSPVCAMPSQLNVRFFLCCNRNAVLSFLFVLS
jgi:hypothetical protein